MKPEVKKMWVEALRSGKYKQAKGALYKHGAFCCLGVLCEISPVATTYNKSGMFIPNEVQDWAHIDCCNPTIGAWTAVDLNDDEHKTFTEIADLIEAYL